MKHLILTKQLIYILGIGFLTTGCATWEQERSEEKATQLRAKNVIVATSMSVTEAQNWTDVGPVEGSAMRWLYKYDYREKAREAILHNTARKGGSLLVIESQGFEKRKSSDNKEEEVYVIYGRAYQKKEVSSSQATNEPTPR